MAELLTAAQMRAIEAAAIASGSVTGLELMERAGRGVVDAVFEEWPELATGSLRAAVLCGPGNNGGDGFVVARLLQDAGWEVEVFLYGDSEKLPPDARTNYVRWGGEVRPLNIAEMDRAGTIPHLVVDAVFGSGLTRPVSRDLADAVTHYAWTFLDGVPVVAVDCPSGLCLDSGRSLGVKIADDAPHRDKVYAPADVLDVGLTVSFHALKAGHVLSDGPTLSGKAVVCDIGLDRRAAQRVLGTIPNPATDENRDPAAVILGLERLFYTARFMQGHRVLGKDPEEHKYSHGHAFILSGGMAQTGAARLAARGALRIGAGLVTVGSPPEALAENAAHLTAIMLTGVHDGDALARVLKDERVNALCLGPGLGKDARESGLILAALDAQRPTVLDADALSILFFDEADALFGKLHDKCVLTPHAGEFARLFPDIAEKLNAPATKGPAYSKVDATREAAKRAGCTVLFKGPDTVIASPNGRCSINASTYERSAPWLATAGSGDVLAGFITGLLARGFLPHHAAETGAFLHTECALSFGAGLIAEDLPEELPKVLKALLY